MSNGITGPLLVITRERQLKMHEKEFSLKLTSEMGLKGNLKSQFRALKISQRRVIST